MKKLLFILILINLPILAFANENKRNEGLIDIGNGLVEGRDYYKDGMLKEITTYDYNTGKPNGERRFYDKKGNIIDSEWFREGELVDKQTFLEAEKKRKMSKGPIIYSEKEKNEGTRIDNFSKNLEDAWLNKNHEYYKNLISSILKKEPDWIPALLAEFGYQAWVEMDLDGARNTSEKIIKLMSEEKEVKNEEKHSMIISLLNSYLSFLDKKIQEKEKTIDILKSTFPGSELIIVYGRSKGYELISSPKSFMSNVEKEVKERKEKNKQDKGEK